MSDATYRIEVEHDPHSDMWPWDARVTRLSDDWPMHTAHGTTPEEAVERARDWIRTETGRQSPPSRPLYVDDNGDDAPMVKLAPGVLDPRD